MTDTSGIVPDSKATLEVVDEIEAKIGFIENGGDRSVQIVINRKDLENLDVIRIEEIPK